MGFAVAGWSAHYAASCLSRMHNFASPTFRAVHFIPARLTLSYTRFTTITQPACSVFFPLFALEIRASFKLAVNSIELLVMPQSSGCLTFFRPNFFHISFRFTVFFFSSSSFCSLTMSLFRSFDRAVVVICCGVLLAGDLTNIRCRHKGQNRDTNRLREEEEKKMPISCPTRL